MSISVHSAFQQGSISQEFRDLLTFMTEEAWKYLAKDCLQYLHVFCWEQYHWHVLINSDFLATTLFAPVEKTLS